MKIGNERWGALRGPAGVAVVVSAGLLHDGKSRIVELLNRPWWSASATSTVVLAKAFRRTQAGTLHP
jgi:hypothetical protein